MPLFIPLILGAASLLSAGHGVKKGIEAHDDNKAAERINSKAETISENAKRKIEHASEVSMDRLGKLAVEKSIILFGSMNDFINDFVRIKNINFSESEGLNEISKLGDMKREFIELKESTASLSEAAKGGVAGAVGGYLLSSVVHASVLSAVTHGGLAGAAATNHALAILGGGAKAVGGLGMAGGSAVLGGLIAGPAIAIAGSVFASQARTRLNNAHSNLEEAEVFEKQAENTALVLGNVALRASQLTGVLKVLDTFFRSGVENLHSIIENSGEDYSKYTTEERKSVAACITLAKTIKSIIDNKVLNENGELEAASLECLEKGQNTVMLLEEGK